MMTELEKLKNLISAIEEGNCDKVRTALDAGIVNGNDENIPLHVALRQRNPNLEIIEVLLEKGADPCMENSNGENALCLAIKNKKLRNIFSQEAEHSLLEGLDINYHYSGPLNDKKQKVNKDADNYLHIAARAGNTDAFLLILKKSIKKNVRLLEYNKDYENPFHDAARMGILRAVIKGTFEHLESTASNEIKKTDTHIKKAKEAGNNEDLRTNKEKLKKVKEKLENDKSYIVGALRSKCALNKYKKTPLGCVSKTEKEYIKKAAGIEDSIIRNKKLHLGLYIIGAIVAIAALCLSLYFLFLVSQTFALSAAVGIASGAASVLLVKASSEIYESYEGDASMQDVGITQVSVDGVAV